MSWFTLSATCPKWRGCCSKHNSMNKTCVGHARSPWPSRCASHELSLCVTIICLGCYASRVTDAPMSLFLPKSFMHIHDSEYCTACINMLLIKVTIASATLNWLNVTSITVRLRQSPWEAGPSFFLNLSPWHSLPEEITITYHIPVSSCLCFSKYDRKFSNRTWPAWGPEARPVPTPRNKMEPLEIIKWKPFDTAFLNHCTCRTYYTEASNGLMVASLLCPTTKRVDLEIKRPRNTCVAHFWFLLSYFCYPIQTWFF